jgi:hypothetical protein
MIVLPWKIDAQVKPAFSFGQLLILDVKSMRQVLGWQHDHFKVFNFVFVTKCQK